MGNDHIGNRKLPDPSKYGIALTNKEILELGRGVILEIEGNNYFITTNSHEYPLIYIPSGMLISRRNIENSNDIDFYIVEEDMLLKNKKPKTKEANA
jgi:hypothetical protein